MAVACLRHCLRPAALPLRSKYLEGRRATAGWEVVRMLVSPLKSTSHGGANFLQIRHAPLFGKTQGLSTYTTVKSFGYSFGSLADFHIARQCQSRIQHVLAHDQGCFRRIAPDHSAQDRLVLKE